MIIKLPTDFLVKQPFEYGISFGHKLLVYLIKFACLPSLSHPQILKMRLFLQADHFIYTLKKYNKNSELNLLYQQVQFWLGQDTKI